MDKFPDVKKIAVFHQEFYLYSNLTHQEVSKLYTYIIGSPIYKMDSILPKFLRYDDKGETKVNDVYAPKNVFKSKPVNDKTEKSDDFEPIPRLDALDDVKALEFDETEE